MNEESHVSLGSTDKNYRAQSRGQLERGESGECLCGHTLIRELCHITNRINGNTAIVGNHCIIKFQKENPDLEIFKSALRIHNAAKKILDDPTASANEYLIDFARQKGALSSADATYYRDIWRKRKLTDSQQSCKNRLNQRILYRLILSVKDAYLRLKQNPKEGTAGSKLIDYACTYGVIQEKAKQFYLDIWERAHSDLTARQKAYKEDLNQKIIEKLRNFLEEDSSGDLSQEIVG
ncbi:MAG: hypothetical protein IT584_03435 [Chlamydiae bacterium]|nr:hypothetical protein [Chlamydiota bacterium]